MRPTKFNDELASNILHRLSMGESARQICRDKEMPSLSTLMKWLTDTDKQEFSEQYARARGFQADYYADQVVDLADELDETADNNAIQRCRLRIDSRKWKVARMMPKKWGDKHAVDVTSSDDTFKPTIIKLVAKEIPDG
jgi:hypothetical protein